MKRVFIFHGWDGKPEHGWYLWLKDELVKKGFEAFVPVLPNTESPRINEWVPAISKIVGRPDKDTYLVGHSLSCQAVARYLETLPPEVKIGGIVFVAGFFRQLTEISAREKETADHWMNAPVDLNKVGVHFTKSVAIFSDDDPYVSLVNQKDFRDKLGCEIIIEHKAGHFMGDDGRNDLKIALDKILEFQNS